MSDKSSRARSVLLLGGCGYVGSALYRHLTMRGFHVDTVDLEWFGNVVNPDNLRRDYATLTRERLARYESVLLFAGHSSVPMCAGNREASFKNNVANFVDLLGKLDSQRFLYASSASVYGNTAYFLAPEDWPRFSPKNYYDVSKCEIDYYARMSSTAHFGLRLGTVNGCSPHLRTDVMLNKMYASFRETGKLTVTNPEVSRPILGTRDLCRAVERILEAKAPEPGIYNLGSFNATVGEITERAAVAMGVSDVRLLAPTPSYDMRMSMAKFEAAFDFKFEDTIETIVDSLGQGWEQARRSTREEPRRYV